MMESEYQQKLRMKTLEKEFTKKRKHEFTKELPKDFREVADSAIDHFGSMLDNMKITDSLDIGICITLGYLSHELFTPPKNATLSQHALAAVYGPLAFRLATTMSGGGEVGIELLGFGLKIPFNSQTVGLSMLAILGAVPAITGLNDWLINQGRLAKEKLYNNFMAQHPVILDAEGKINDPQASLKEELARLESQYTFNLIKNGSWALSEEAGQMSLEIEEKRKALGLPY